MTVFKKYIGDLFVSLRLYVAAGACLVVYVASFFVPAIFPFANILFTVLCVLAAADYFFLFILFKSPLASRAIGDRLNNGEENPVTLTIVNRMPFSIALEITDELPFQLQRRDFAIRKKLAARETISQTYTVIPAERGVYEFGNIILFFSSLLGLVQRRYAENAAQNVKVFPAFAGLGQYRLLASATTTEQGTRRMRKIGHSMEFEQIKDYVSGDDIRSINWRATARKGGIMVNHFSDEKSQQVYCVIDKGRLMKMPFCGLSLLDYAINATLALSNVCLQKQDRIGLISFAEKPGTVIAADRKPVQRENIIRALYREETNFAESDFEMLYMQVRKRIRQRSLLIIFTNFESLNGLKRQVSYLRALAKHHLVLVIFFENTELTALSVAHAKNIEDVYVKTIADKFAFEKRMVVKELRQFGILSVLTSPSDLTVNAVNKYLELKAKQAL